MLTNQALLDSKPSHKPSTAMAYLSFQNAIIKLSAKLSQSKLSARSAMSEMIHDLTLFKPSNDKSTQLHLSWPHKIGPKEITIQAVALKNSDAKNPEYVLDVYDDHKILSLSMRTASELTVKQVNTHPKWDQSSIRELVANLNLALHAKQIVYTYNDGISIKENRKKGEHHFSKEHLDKLINQYGDGYHLTYKINNVILKHSIKNIDTFKFFLQWPDSQKKTHTIAAHFSWHEPFSSHLCSESAFLSGFPEYKQLNAATKNGYYYLSLYETPLDKKVKPIAVLSLWLTYDGQFSELRDIDKGYALSGNEIIKLYQYFDNFFKPKTTLLCDGSKLKSSDESEEACLRVIYALATGKTWYESKIPGLKLFETHHFDTGAFGILNQNISRRNKALTELQSVSIKQWRAMLKPNDAKNLSTVCKKFNLDEKSTLQSLTLSIYNNAKQKKCFTHELGVVCKLLHKNMHHPNEYSNIPKSSDQDYYVASRVYELVWGGFTWIKIRDDKDSKLNSKSTKDCKSPIDTKAGPKK